MIFLLFLFVPTVIGVETAKGVETTYSVDATGEDVSW
jgi:hypothetical protein